MPQNTEKVSLPALVNKAGFIHISLGYNTGWVMPVEDGLKLIESLQRAHAFSKPYNEVPTVSTLPPISFEFISQEQIDAWNVQEILTV